ncbi:MAG: sulfatase-like hydrolase/transferase [Clostridium sp.]|nr:sulfatase-like hydrolase/transferase [Clostridium sp.]
MVQILFIFLCYTALLALGKAVFVLYVGGYAFGDLTQAIWHGLAMDMTMAGYFTVIPALLLIALQWADPHWKDAPAWSINPPRDGSKPTKAVAALRMAMKAYFWITAAIITFGVVLNAALYPYWKFPLDQTPLFYFFSSPKSAMASISFMQLTGAAVTIALIVCLCKKALAVCSNLGKGVLMPKNRVVGACLLALATTLLFIPIRGGFTVSTMNPSRAYFSKDMRLNHAAMDPLFSLMYSLSHADDFAKQFRFMDNAEAERKFSEIRNWEEADSASFTTKLPFKPHIQLIILESFSSHLMPSLGGEPIAMRLDSIAREGLLFTDIYASSFRTDRALAAILNGYPAQPTSSIMKYVDKLDSLPAIASSLRDAGYATSYYYGGDANFTNMNALLVAGGFDRIVSDKDFPMSQRLSKWGAHDDVVFTRAIEEISSEKEAKPRFTVVQTSSSHEPYEVPYASRHADKAANAFAYADSCLGAYMDQLRQTAAYDSTLVFIVPDHYGSYPRDLEDHLQRHRVPLVIAGGAAKYLAPDSTVLQKAGSQTDIAATILALAGADAGKFEFSRNLLDPRRASIAFFSEPSWIAATDGEGYAEIETATLQPAEGSDQRLLEALKAYYQHLYNDIARR